MKFFVTMVNQKAYLDILLLPHIFVREVLRLLFDIVQYIPQGKKTQQVKINKKKVLLRERKRHTGRSVASIHCAGGEGAYLDYGGGVLILARGYLPWPGGTYLVWGRGATCPSTHCAVLSPGGYLPWLWG